MLVVSGTQSAINTLTLDQLDLFANTGQIAWIIPGHYAGSGTGRGVALSDHWTGKLPSTDHFPEHSSRNPDTLFPCPPGGNNWIPVTDSESELFTVQRRLLMATPRRRCILLLRGFKACHTSAKRIVISLLELQSLLGQFVWIAGAPCRSQRAAWTL